MAEVRTYGYARVSSKDQNVDRQVDVLKGYVPEERNIFIDKASGKDFERDAYKALKLCLRDGDTLYVTSIDRLGRTKTGIIDELRELRKIGVIVRILDLPTTMLQDTGDGLIDVINNIMIEMLAYIAETERRNIRKRQEEGIAAARKRGKKFGRKKNELPDGWEIGYADLLAGKITVSALARQFKMTRQSLYRRLSEIDAKLKKEEEESKKINGEPLF